MYNAQNVHATHRSRVLATETQSGPVPCSLLLIDTPTSGSGSGAPVSHLCWSLCPVATLLSLTTGTAEPELMMRPSMNNTASFGKTRVALK